MRRLILLFLALVSPSAPHCVAYRDRFVVTKVLDGDTVSIDVSTWMPPAGMSWMRVCVPTSPLNTSLSIHHDDRFCAREPSALPREGDRYPGATPAQPLRPRVQEAPAQYRVTLSKGELAEAAKEFTREQLSRRSTHNVGIEICSWDK